MLWRRGGGATAAGAASVAALAWPNLRHHSTGPPLHSCPRCRHRRCQCRPPSAAASSRPPSSRPPLVRVARPRPVPCPSSPNSSPPAPQPPPRRRMESMRAASRCQQAEPPPSRAAQDSSWQMRGRRQGRCAQCGGGCAHHAGSLMLETFVPSTMVTTESRTPTRSKPSSRLVTCR